MTNQEMISEILQTMDEVDALKAKNRDMLTCVALSSADCTLEERYELAYRKGVIDGCSSIEQMLNKKLHKYIAMDMQKESD